MSNFTIPPVIPLLEEILAPRSSIIGDQYEAYKNHVYRVVHFCFAFHECTGEDRDKLVIAGAFHDLGMWPGDEIDYLAPSIALARSYLNGSGRSAWTDEISAMIEWHHRFRKAPVTSTRLVEIFRKGDWVDATRGIRRFGLPQSVIRDVEAAFPNLGFHNNLIRIAVKEFWNRPFNPLPMMRW